MYSTEDFIMDPKGTRNEIGKSKGTDTSTKTNCLTSKTPEMAPHGYLQPSFFITV